MKLHGQTQKMPGCVQQGRTAGSNLTLQWSHSGQISVLLYMPCMVEQAGLQTADPGMANRAASMLAAGAKRASAASAADLEVVDDDRVVIGAVILPSFRRPLLVWLPRIVPVLGTERSPGQVTVSHQCRLSRTCRMQSRDRRRANSLATRGREADMRIHAKVLTSTFNRKR